MNALSEDAIREFQELYKAEYGRELSFAEAKEQAQNLFNLFSLIVQK